MAASAATTSVEMGGGSAVGCEGCGGMELEDGGAPDGDEGFWAEMAGLESRAKRRTKGAERSTKNLNEQFNGLQRMLAGCGGR
jgi:hypothetical protein